MYYYELARRRPDNRLFLKKVVKGPDINEYLPVYAIDMNQAKKFPTKNDAFNYANKMFTGSHWCTQSDWILRETSGTVNQVDAYKHAMGVV